MIEITNLSKIYKNKKGASKVLDGVSLSVREGEVLGLIGPNGAGKTTLMHCMLGLVHPTSGNILINGHVPNHLAVKRILAYLPERPLFDGWMTARQFLQYHHMLSGGKDSTAKDDIEGVLDLVQLESSARSRIIRTFSKGMLQRLGLAQMLVGNPKLCFLDEPTSGLDPVSRNLVRSIIGKWKEEGATVILNSHHLDEVERVCDRVAFIQKGRIELIERTRQIENARVSVILKWTGPAGAEERLHEVAAHALFECEIAGPYTARFILRTKSQIPVLVRGLVDAQLDVEELFIERSRLEELFNQGEGKKSDE